MLANLRRGHRLRECVLGVGIPTQQLGFQVAAEQLGSALDCRGATDSTIHLQCTPDVAMHQHVCALVLSSRNNELLDKFSIWKNALHVTDNTPHGQ
jgi:hypothetical protein